MGIYKVMGENGNELRTDVVLHPGEVLSEELKERKIKKSAFAMEIKIYPSHFSDILKGRRNISATIALKLEEKINIPAEFWMRLQAEYDLTIARKKLVMV